MHLLGAGVAHHLHDLERGGAAHDRIVDQHDALARDHRAVGAVLQAHAELADRLRRLDEGAADIVVADDAELVGDAGGLRKADRRRHAGIRHRHDHVGVRRRFARQLARPWSCAPRRRGGRRRSNRAARNRCIRRCRAAPPSAGTACAIARRPRRTPRPRRSRRRARYCAPMMSSAQVSEARIGRRRACRSPAGGCRADRARRSASCW